MIIFIWFDCPSKCRNNKQIKVLAVISCETKLMEYAIKAKNSSILRLPANAEEFCLNRKTPSLKTHQFYLFDFYQYNL